MHQTISDEHLTTYRRYSKCLALSDAENDSVLRFLTGLQVGWSCGLAHPLAEPASLCLVDSIQQPCHVVL
jgi:hypothetical protein